MALRSEFNYRTLTKSIQNIKRAPRQGIDTFARKGQNLPTRVVDMASLSGAIQMAPMCQRKSAGKAVGKETMQIDYHIFPDIRLYTPFSDDDVESLTILYPNALSNPNVMAIYRDKIVRQQAKFKEMIYYRINWMFWSALNAGTWTYDDSKGAKYVMDYNMPSGNKLSPGLVWSNASADPFGDLDTLRAKTGENSSLGEGNVFVMGTTSWSEFKKHANVLAALDNRRVEIGNITSAGNKDVLRPVGRYDDCDIYVCREKDDAGTALVDAEKVICFNTSNDIWYDFGRVPEPQAGNGAITDIFSKIYYEDNPAAEILLVHSCPLLFIGDIKNVAYVTT